MSKGVAGWIALVCGVLSSGAHACKIPIHPNPAREFVRIALVAEPPSAVIFKGEVVSVSESHDASGGIVIDAVMRPLETWLGKPGEAAIVRSFGSTAGPCRFPLAVDAHAGERWLVFGWARDGRIEPSIDLRASLRLENGRITEAVAKELRRIKR